MRIRAVFEFELPDGMFDRQVEAFLEKAVEVLKRWAGHNVRLNDWSRAPEMLRCQCGGTRFMRHWEDKVGIFRDEDGEVTEASSSPTEPELTCLRCGRRLEMPGDWR